MEKEYSFINATNSTIYESSEPSRLTEATFIDQAPLDFFEQTVCIELENSNRIWTSFKITWTVRHLIKEVLSSKAFKRFYPSYRSIKIHSRLLEYFDLKLVILRNLEDVVEVRIDQDTKLEILYNLELIKNSKYPFFVLVDNRNKLVKTAVDQAKCIDLYKQTGTVSSEKLYTTSLPRMRTVYKLLENNVYQ